MDLVSLAAAGCLLTDLLAKLTVAEAAAEGRRVAVFAAVGVTEAGERASGPAFLALRVSLPSRHIPIPAAAVPQSRPLST